MACLRGDPIDVTPFFELTGQRVLPIPPWTLAVLATAGLEQGHRWDRTMANPIPLLDSPAGIQALLPHVSKFVPAHNLQSIKSLADALRR